MAAAVTGMAMLAALAILMPSARGLSRAEFPPGFLFGGATSAYQIEGAYLEDGKGLSNWDFFTHTSSGGIRDGRNGDIADDHYHRYMEDVEIIHSLGVNSYRFSISWARILPRGRLGGVNSAGIAFYDRLIAALVQKGIEPFVTLHHFDLLHEMETRYGGWLGAEIRYMQLLCTCTLFLLMKSAECLPCIVKKTRNKGFPSEEFDYYADVCFKAFGDRVKFWTTFNEPNLFTRIAYMMGKWPPARCSVPFGTCKSGNSHHEPYVAAHNMLLSHAAAVHNYKKNYQAMQGGSIGIVIAMKWYEPLTNTTEDILAARRALSFETDWFLEPIFFGDYPREMHELLSSNLPKLTSEEKSLLQKNKVDFIGINHYTTIYVKDCISSRCDLNTYETYEGNALVLARGERDGVAIGKPTALDGYYDVPEGMELIVNYVNQRYENTPVYVTENGYSQHSNNTMDKLINDSERVNYLHGYLTCLSSAVRKGANVCGYFVWSIIDNFEWAFGFTVRFGLYHVDYETQKRTPKMSAKWYQDFLMGSRPTDQVQTVRADS